MKHRRYTYFSLKEFASPDFVGSGSMMKPEFLVALDTARRVAGVPFRITSGYRTPEHNEKVGGVANSAHTRGWAADIVAPDLPTAMRIITAGYGAGIRRFGYYPGRKFVHMDMDPHKPSPVFWEG